MELGSVLSFLPAIATIFGGVKKYQATNEQGDALVQSAERKKQSNDMQILQLAQARNNALGAAQRKAAEARRVGREVQSNLIAKMGSRTDPQSLRMQARIMAQAAYNSDVQMFSGMDQAQQIGWKQDQLRLEGENVMADAKAGQAASRSAANAGLWSTGASLLSQNTENIKSMYEKYGKKSDPGYGDSSGGFDEQFGMMNPIGSGTFV